MISLTNCSLILLGDKDGFGIGLAEESPLFMEAGTALPLDNRDASDPRFTDVYPANLGSDEWGPHQIIFDIVFSEPVNSIESIMFRAFTLGIQDGDSQVLGSNTDIKLYFDDNEVPLAFDTVDQFENYDGKWADFASMVEIEISDQFYSLLIDGKVTVRWEIYQLSSTSESYDSFAIDYCELQICKNENVTVDY
jgi:hypothetical protein